MYIQVDERKRTDVLSTTYYQDNSDNLDDRLEQFVQSPVFDKKYSFDGELGALYTPQRTILRLWAPTALSVEVIVYESLYRKREEKTHDGKGGRGTHELIMIGDYADCLQICDYFPGWQSSSKRSIPIVTRPPQTENAPSLWMQ